MIFRDRKQAGQALALRLKHYKKQKPVVLALPRGGVPIAAEIAKVLEAPLDVLIVRKIGAPFQPELAVGAICEEADPIWKDPILCRFGLEPDDLSRTVTMERNRINKQTDLFRESRKIPSVVQRIVIVVDDGVATGATMLAAIRYLKKKGAMKIVAAVPVGPYKTARQLRKKVDDLVILEERDDFMSVGQWYKDCSQVADDEVVSLLKRNAAQKHA